MRRAINNKKTRFGGFFFAWCLGLSLSLPAWSVTSIDAGTDLSTVLNAAGSYELQPGTHTVSTGFTIAADVTLTSAPDAALVIAASQTLKFSDRDVIEDNDIRMSSGSVFQAEAVSGDTETRGARIEGNAFSRNGTISANPYVRFGQGFNSYHRNNMVVDNDFYQINILQEVGEGQKYINNRFYNMAGLRPIQLWGKANRVIGNYVSGGITGILYLADHSIGSGAPARSPCTQNVTSGNIVLDTTEEAISMDLTGDSATRTVAREYDTIGSLGGSPVVTLASGNWSAQTTYTGSKYDLVVVSATNASMVGKRYKIITHLGAAFTTDISSSDYANLTIGDGVAVILECYENTISNNVALPMLASDRAYTSGIVLHGLGLNTTISNNITRGEYDGVGTGDIGAYDYYAIREASLNGITATDSVTGLKRRAPVGLNTISTNRSLGGGVGVDYNNYDDGVTADYTPPASTSTGNAVVTAADVGWSGGTSPTTAAGFCLDSDSALLGAGTYIGAYVLGYGGESLTNPPPIGARGLCNDRRASLTRRAAHTRRESPTRREVTR